MTYHYTDPDGDRLHVTPITRYGKPAINLRVARNDSKGSAAVDIPVDQLEDVVDGLRAVRREAVGAHPGIPRKNATPDASALREQIAEALYTHDHPGWSLRMADSDTADQYRARADAAVATILPTTRLTAELHKSAEADVQRVTTLYEQWVKSGPPPLGTSMSRWWDARLVELRSAILPPAEE